MISVSIVYAGYNEEENVSIAVEKTIASFQETGIDYEILLIDDASADRTWVEMEKCANKYSNVYSMKNIVNLNFGTSVLEGLILAKKDFVIYNAFDLPLHPEKIVSVIKNGGVNDADIIVLERSNYPCTRKRKLFSFLNKMALKILFPILTRGTPILNFTQMFRREIIDEIIPISRGPIFIWPEMVFRARLKGYRIKNIVMPCNPDMKLRKGSFGHPHDILWGIYEMIRFRVKAWRKKS